MEKLIDKIKSPSDLKQLTIPQLSQYADEVREFIISSVEKNGGHLSSNLGAVDFVIALHYVFDCPNDKLIFDVGHQAYTHKIITGRKDGFDNLRHDNGVSGFVNVAESIYDCCTMGHSSTSLSMGIGFARARDLKNEDYNVVSIIGDGALTGGIAFEALNDIGESKTPMLIVLNDNTMSISKNVGGISKHLSKLRLSKKYVAFKHSLKRGLSAIPFIGKGLSKLTESIRDGLKNMLMRNKIFEDFGIKYLGPFDGHDIKLLVSIFQQANHYSRPALIHLVTSKGKGSKYAEDDPTTYHGVSAQKNNEEKAFSKAFSDKIVEIGEKNKGVVTITAAMTTGTGLSEFAKKFPDRFFDVGIAEQHAVSFASGLARGGIRPVFAVYSTFLQRGFDEVMTDLCIDSTPVILAIDHSGYVDGDGVTHQGVFDSGYLSMIPNLIVASPKDGEELARMMDFALAQNQPIAIKYPKSYRGNYNVHTPITLGKWEILKNEGDIVILANSAKAVEIANQIDEVTVVNARFNKPLDYEMLDSFMDKNVITIEDGMLRGGFGENVLSYLNSKGYSKTFQSIGFGDRFITETESVNAYKKAGLTVENVKSVINNMNKTL